LKKDANDKREASHSAEIRA